MAGKSLPLWLVLSTILLCFLTPSLPLLEGIPSIRLEQIVVFLVFFYVLLILFIGQVRLGFSPAFFFASLVFSVYIFFSCFIGGIKGFSFMGRDFLELLKPFEYTIVGLLALTAMSESKYSREVVLKTIVLCGVVSFFIGLSQFFNPMNINSYYVHMIAPTQYETLVGGYAWPRVIGLTSNPNVYAFLMVLAAVSALFVALVYKNHRYWFYWLLISLGLIISQSRTGLVFFMLVHVVFLVPYFIKHSFGLDERGVVLKYKNILILTMMVILAVTVFTYIIMNSMLMLRIEEASDMSESASVVARMEHWIEYWGIFTTNMVLGIGPAKSIEFAAAADNEWLLLGVKYGLVGLFLFVFFLFSPLFEEVEEGEESKCYKWLTIALLCGGMVFMLPAGIYHSVQTFPVFLIMLLLMVKPSRLVIGV